MSESKPPSPPSSLEILARRYFGSSNESLSAVLCPLLIPIRSLDKTIVRLAGQSHHRASFTIELTEANRTWIVKGRTGKFVPASHNAGGIWSEIAKGRIISVNHSEGIAEGEIYTGGHRANLVQALAVLTASDFLEIDRYGAAAKVLSALAEHSFVERAEEEGFQVYRMPEDMAQHLGIYLNYDFDLVKDGIQKRVEVKSIWGTNTRYARLIHSLTTRPRGSESTWSAEQRQNYYPTSSCKFSGQDIFAVSLFLRTGNVRDFAFARSVPRDLKPYGLPRSSGYPEHVHQNPLCTIGDGSWFPSLQDVWDLE